MTTIILVRHGESEANANNEIAGDPNAPLSAKGRLQAEQLAAYLKDRHFDVVISSDRPRALDTARSILRFLPNELDMSTLLRERDWGDLATRAPEEYHRQLFESGATFVEFVPVNGESFLHVEKRVAEFVRTVLDGSTDSTVLIVAHESVNKMMLKILLGLGWDEFLSLKQPNACVNVLDVDSSGAVNVGTLASIEHLHPEKPSIY